MTTADRAARAAAIGVTVAPAATGIAPADPGWAERMLLDMVRLGSESLFSSFDTEGLLLIITSLGWFSLAAEGTTASD